MYTGTHDGATLYSTISFNVDEFKFFKILKNVVGQTTDKLWGLDDSFPEESQWWDRETQVESD
jgi:hypothetical protein